MSELKSAGARFRAAVREERPLQVVGAVNAYFARLAEHSGYKALYLSGGGVAACSCGIPDLGITTMEDVLIDAIPEEISAALLQWEPRVLVTGAEVSVEHRDGAPVTRVHVRYRNIVDSSEQTAVVEP